MIQRKALKTVQNALASQAAVALIGSRQVGKTTLALQLGAMRPSIYLDMESARDRQKLHDARVFLTEYEDQLVIIDEVHHMPSLFAELRGIIDEGKRKGKGRGRFLLLGSASMDLMKQSETLAGRIAYIELPILSVTDISASHQTEVDKLWLRGGYPENYLLENNAASLRQREQLIMSYLELDIPLFAPRLPRIRIERLWRMLAHHHSTVLNKAQLGSNLEISNPAVHRYVELLTDLFLVRQLEPYHTNLGKRLVRRPKTYIRDSGLLHALLGIETREELYGHPLYGASWEGFVIENILNNLQRRTLASFYRTQAGSEIDLILEMGVKGTWAIEIKRSSAPKLGRGFYAALEDIKPDKTFVIYTGDNSYPYSEGIDIITLPELLEKLQDTSYTYL